MSQIISKDLNGRGTRFVNSQLEAGGALARAVLAVRGPATNASAPLPEELDPATLTDFEYGGRTSLDATIDWLVPEILRLYPEGSRLLLVIEDPWARFSDVPDNSRGALFRLAGEETVAYALNGDQINEHNLKGVLNLLLSFCFNGFVVDTTGLPSHAAGDLAATDLAKHVKKAFVSAFDRDGLIIADWA